MKKIIKTACMNLTSKIYWHLNNMSHKEKSIMEFLWTISISAITSLVTVQILKRI